MKKIIVNILLIFTIVLILLVFGFCILGGNYQKINFFSNYLDENLICPSDMDLNDDLKLDNSDSAYLKSIIENSSKDNLKLDLNKDNVINNTDFTLYVDCFSRYDLDQNKLIDCNDFNVLSDNIKKYSGSVTDDSLKYDLNSDKYVDDNDSLLLLKILSKIGQTSCYEFFYDNTFILNDKTIIVDSEKNIISRIKPGTKVSEFLNIVVADKNHVSMIDSIDSLKNENEIVKTGDKIIFNDSDSHKIIYTISVLGDVLGTGVITRDSAEKIARHIVDKDIFVTEDSAVILSADYNKDGVIKMNDVMLLFKSIENNE